MLSSTEESSVSWGGEVEREEPRMMESKLLIGNKSEMGLDYIYFWFNNYELYFIKKWNNLLTHLQMK